MRQLLASQVQRKNEIQITLPAERRVLNLMRDVRLKPVLEGMHFKVLSAIKNVVPEGLLQDQLAACIEEQHELRSTASAEIGGVVFWSKEYRRAVRKCASYFMFTLPDGSQRRLVNVKNMVVCVRCKRMWLLCNQYNTTFYGIQSQYVLNEKW